MIDAQDDIELARARARARARSIPPIQAEGTRQMPGTRPNDPRSGGEIAASLAANAVDALTLGGLDELAAGTGAIGGMFSGEGATAGGRAGYRGMKLLREGGQQYDPAGTRLARGTGLIAGILPALAASGGAGAVPLWRSAASAGGLGAMAGLLSEGGAGERVRNAGISGAISAAVPPIFAGTMWAAGKVPGVAAGLAKVLPGATGRAGEAADVVANRMAMDRAGGIATPPILHPSVPALAIDEAGPAVQGLAKGILRAPGEGRAILGGALERRSEQMRPAITAELERRTGMPATRARAMLTDIADEQSALARAQDAVAEQQKTLNTTARQPIAQPSALDAVRAFEREVGPLPNGITETRRVMEETKGAMRAAYDEARVATNGFQVDSPTFRAIVQTPIGKQAWEFAQLSKANAGTPVPTVEQAVSVGGLPAERIAAVNARNAERGLPPIPTESIPVPDPESVHLMKRFFASVARLGQQDGAQGLQAARAQGALRQWGAINTEILDPAWQQADAIATKLFGMQRAVKLGLDAGRATTNPGSKQALAMSLQAIRDRVATMSPDELSAFGPTLRFAVGNRIQRASPNALRGALANPRSDLSQLVVLATGDASAPGRIAAAVAKNVPAKAPILAIPEASSTLRAAQRGLAALTTPAEASGANAAHTLPVLARDVSASSPAERAVTTQAAAANLRQAWEGVPTGQKSPGLFFAKSPERVEQVGYAFGSPQQAGLFQRAVTAWDDAQALKARLMGGGAMRPPTSPSRAHGHQSWNGRSPITPRWGPATPPAESRGVWDRRWPSGLAAKWIPKWRRFWRSAVVRCPRPRPMQPPGVSSPRCVVVSGLGRE